MVKRFPIRFASIFLCLIYHIASLSIPYTIIKEIDESDYQTLPIEYSNKMRFLKSKKCDIKKLNKVYIVEVYIGSKQTVRLKLTSLFQGIIVSDNKLRYEGFDSLESNSIEIIEPHHQNKIGSGSIVADTIRFPSLDLTFHRFPFFLISDTEYSLSNYQGLWGFAFNEEDYTPKNLKSSFNFFEWFAGSEPNSKKILGLISHNSKEGEMVVRDFPIEMTKNMKKYKKCKVVVNHPHQSNWICFLNAIYFSDSNIIKVNENIDFIIGGNISVVSESVLDFIRNNYFEEAFERKICKIKNEFYIEIICNTKDFDLKKLGDISFVFGKMTIKLNTDRLFYEEGNEFHFAISSRKKLNGWYFSPGLFLNYYVIFDKDNDEIGFYNTSS